MASKIDTANTGAAFPREKRRLWLFSIFTALVPGVAAGALYVTGNAFWSLVPLIYYFGLIPVIDMAVGEDRHNPDEADFQRLATDGFYRRVLYAALIAHYLVFATAAIIIGVANIPIWAFVAIAASTGVGSGAALTVGHELGHKPSKRDQIAALFANALSCYAHFRIEHNRGHHIAVATPEDPASARLGESIYQFALREIPGAAKRGWRLEADRLRKAGKTFVSFDNEVLRGYVLAFAIAAILIAAFGVKMIAFIIIHHAAAWLQLTFANYVEHYGLLRRKLPSGKYEPCAPHHSWNSNYVVSNLALFHLQRHSDHHANPMRPYQTLRNFNDLPSLPMGYAGCFLLAAIPPLWFAVMDKKALAWADGDPTRLNRKPVRADRRGDRLAA